MYKLDEQERLIVRELIRNPQVSDNQIALRTNVPLKTVNRKRKNLEEHGFLRYYCQLDLSPQGTATFLGRGLFVTLFREGLTRKQVGEGLHHSVKAASYFPKHVVHSFLAEMEGSVALVTMLESHRADDLYEIYNAEIIPELESFLGRGCVRRTLSLPVRRTLRSFRNYVPERNMQNGRIKEEWRNEFLFVDEP